MSSHPRVQGLRRGDDGKATTQHDSPSITVGKCWWVYRPILYNFYTNWWVTGWQSMGPVWVLCWKGPRVRLMRCARLTPALAASQMFSFELIGAVLKKKL